MNYRTATFDNLIGRYSEINQDADNVEAQGHPAFANGMRSVEPHFHSPHGNNGDVLCQHHFSETAPYLNQPDTWRMCRGAAQATCTLCLH